MDGFLNFRHLAKTKYFSVKLEFIFEYEDKYRRWYQSHVAYDSLQYMDDLDTIIDIQSDYIDEICQETFAYIEQAPLFYLEKSKIEWFLEMLNNDDKLTPQEIFKYLDISCDSYKFYSYDVDPKFKEFSHIEKMNWTAADKEIEFKTTAQDFKLVTNKKGFDALDYNIILNTKS